MLVYEENGNVFALPRVVVKGLFDCVVVGFCIDDHVVLLRVRRLRDVLHLGERMSCDDDEQAWSLTPTPASRMPVTVSSSPMTAINDRSLYADCGRAMMGWTGSG